MNLFGLSSRYNRRFLVIGLLIGVLFSCHDEDETPMPEVTGVNPSSALPSTLISITGKAFSSVLSENKVTFNGKDALVSNASSTQLNVVVPMGAETGPVIVTVNGRQAKNQPVFTVELPPSVIANISPLSGGYNTVVTITGSNFFPTPANNSVTFNGQPGIVTSATATSITVKVPPRAGSGSVAVNGVTAGTTFNYVPDVYIAGYVVDKDGIARATYWKNGVPTTLSTTGQHTFAYDIALDGENVYVVGARSLPLFYVARWWKNGTEMPLSDDANYSTSEAILTVGNDIYIVGYEGISATKYVAKYWKNGTPVELTDGTRSTHAYGIAVNGQDVYAAGNSQEGESSFATYWKNGTPQHVTTGVSFAWNMCLSGSDVYLTGSERNTGPGIGFVTYWKNTTVSRISPGVTGGAGRDIVVVGNDVYVAGVEDNVKGVRLAKFWKNGAPFALSDGSTFAYANGIDVLGEDVYVAGAEVNASGQLVAKYWKNGVPFGITDGGYSANAEAVVLH